jgi:membrane protein YdbS with pleckstrin-like domain
MVRKGIVARHQTEVPISGIREMKFHQGIIDRVVDIGSFGFSTAASTDVEIVFHGVPRPMQLKEIIDSLTSTI